MQFSCICTVGDEYDLMVCIGNKAAGVQSVRHLWNWTNVGVVFCTEEAVAARANDFRRIQHDGDASGVHRRAPRVHNNTLEQDPTAAARETGVHARRRNATARRNGDVRNVKRQMPLAVPVQERL